MNDVDLSRAEVRIRAELRLIGWHLRQPETDNDESNRLYAAQQALVWALEPEAAKSPADMILGDRARPSMPGTQAD